MSHVLICEGGNYENERIDVMPKYLSLVFKERKKNEKKSSNNDVLCPGGAAAYIRVKCRSMVVRVSHVVVVM